MSNSLLMTTPATSNPTATITRNALKRITYVLPAVPAQVPYGLPALARGRSITRTEATRVRHNLGDTVLARARTAATRAAWRERGRHRRLCPRSHGGERSAVGDTCLQVPQLAFQVSLQPAAVFALEGAQVINSALKLLAGLDQRAHGLAVPLLRVALQAFRPGPRVAGNLLRLTPGLGEHLVRLAAGAAQGLVGLPAGVGDGLVGSLLREREHTGGRVHVVLDVRHPAHHDRLRLPALRLHALGRRHHVLLRVRQRRTQRGYRRLTTAQDFRQLGPELFVLLDQPVELSLDLVKEGINLFVVVAGPEPGRTELLIPHIRRRQRHLVSSAHLDRVPHDRTRIKGAARPLQAGSESRRTEP